MSLYGTAQRYAFCDRLRVWRTGSAVPFHASFSSRAASAEVASSSARRRGPFGRLKVFASLAIGASRSTRLRRGVWVPLTGAFRLLNPELDPCAHVRGQQRPRGLVQFLILVGFLVELEHRHVEVGVIGVLETLRQCARVVLGWAALGMRRRLIALSRISVVIVVR